MVVRSEGPLYNIGFGHYQRPQTDRFQEESVIGPNQESGLVAKAMHGNPVMSFLAASAATLVGMGVAGKLVKQGGIKIGIAASNSSKPRVRELVKTFRDIQGTLDDMEGVSRIFADPDDPMKLFAREADGSYRGDTTKIVRGFHITQGEREAARAAGENKLPIEWGIKDEIQQRLVSQARRLPYELPAAYLTQRAVVDPLFGGEKENDVNWANPVDVITDFVDQSVKNLMFMIGPFEAGQGAAAHSFRRLMTYGDGMTAFDPRTMRNAKTAVTLQASMQQVGHDASKLMDKALKFSSQLTGAFATGVEEAARKRVGVVDLLHQMRNGDYKAALRQQEGLAKKALFVGDNIPGTLGGMVTGARRGRERFNEIGQGHEAFKKMMRLGRRKFEATASEAEVRSIGHTMGGSFSPVTSLAEDIRNMGRGSPGVTGKGFTGDWSKSGFYNDRIQDEYNKRLKDNLQRRLENTMEDKAKAKKLVDDFADRHSVDMARAEDTNIGRRLRIGLQSPPISADSREGYVSQFVAKTGLFNKGQQEQLSRHLLGAIDETDNIFRPKINNKQNPLRDNIDRDIQRQWLQAYKNDIPEMSAHMFGKRMPGYNSFDMRVGGADHAYLVDKAAKVAGLDVKAGASKETQEAFLRKMGLNADSPEVLRGFLVGEKQIAKPWQKDGYNAFGLRQITSQQFLERGLHGEDDELGRIIGHLSKSGDERIQTTMPGIYETRGGHILNINKARRSGRRALDVLANEYKIPIVNFNPLGLANYGRNQAMTETSVLSYISGSSRQPFVGDSEGVDFYMMLRRHGRKSKGEVRAFSKMDPGKPLGVFQPTAAGSVGLAGRQARIASGDLGTAPLSEAPLEGTPAQKGRLKSFFLRNNADYQQGSIKSVGNRFMGRNRDVRNPVTMGRLLRGEKVSDARGTYRLVDGELINLDNGKAVASKEEVTDALDVFHRFVNKNVFPKSLHEKASAIPSAQEALTKVRNALSYSPKRSGQKIANKKAAMLAGEDGVISVGDLKTVEEKVSFGRVLQEEGTDEVQTLFKQGRAEEARRLRQARETLIDRHLKDSSGPGYWDKPVGDSKQGAGLSRRIDEFTSDMQQYILMRQGISGQNQFASVVADLGTQLDELSRSGVLTSSETAEAYAALLSTQIHYAKLKTFKGSNDVVETAVKVISGIQGDTARPMQRALEDVASGLTGATGRNSQILNRGHQMARRYLSLADDSYEGFSYSPFGNTDIVLTPSLGQAFKQAGAKRATKSALGVSTYRDPEAFSPVSAFSSHLVDRLNRYANVFGAGLDPTKFTGPIDMFARGMVGQRAMPLYAAGVTGLAADSTLGGLLNDRDEQGDRVYAPYVLGKVATPFAYAQAGIAGLVPGGQNYEQARADIFEGEVPVRRNRYWPLNRTPFRGDSVEYYRPSWYRRMQAGSAYTESGWDNPVERMLFGHDFSPLRPFDPYRFEKKHEQDRPYPLTGDYFTGPYGPVTSILNATVGKVLKPQKEMHETDTTIALSMGYAPVGESGAYSTIPYGMAGGSLGAQGSYSVLNSLGGTTGGDLAGASMSRYNNNVQTPQWTAQGIVRDSLNTANFMLVAAAMDGNTMGPNSAAGAYGIPNMPGIMPPTVIPNLTPVMEGGFQMHTRGAAYRTQEALGIYGFGFGAARTALGFGDQDFTSTAPVLQNASGAYSPTRAFWDLNIGGIGDAPSETLNLNVSEVVRRFVPKTPSGTNFINPISNTMGVENPWLPGANYFTDFTRGDPFTKIKEGEIRLPGQAYERLNRLSSDASGKYGLVDQHKILANVAPYSQEFKSLDAMIDSTDLSPSDMLKLETTRMQVKRTTRKNEFHEYSYDPNQTMSESLIERALHMDNMVTRKLGRHSSAVEDWERDNVYGPTFQQWQTPVESFLKPMIHDATQDNPIHAAGRVGFAMSFFGRTPTARLTASAVGGLSGGLAGLYGNAYEKITGDRFLPKARKEQAALEEYTDVLTYIKNKNLESQAAAAGDAQMASAAARASKRTMYGVDLANARLQDIMAAIPKRKREHFESFLSAPEQERERILSTAPRLERRILQAAWGMKVENLPSLENIFANRELPGPNWEGWDANTNMEQVKIKMGNHMGLDMSQMGYYPQQVQQANLVNPSFPMFGFQDDPRNVRTKLEALMDDMGIQGSVIESPNPFSGFSLNLSQVLF